MRDYRLYEDKMEEDDGKLESDLATIRAGRANPERTE